MSHSPERKRHYARVLYSGHQTDSRKTSTNASRTHSGEQSPVPPGMLTPNEKVGFMESFAPRQSFESDITPSAVSPPRIDEKSRRIGSTVGEETKKRLDQQAKMIELQAKKIKEFENKLRLIEQENDANKAKPTEEVYSALQAKVLDLEARNTKQDEEILQLEKAREKVLLDIARQKEQSVQMSRLTSEDATASFSRGTGFAGPGVNTTFDHVKGLWNDRLALERSNEALEHEIQIIEAQISSKIGNTAEMKLAIQKQDIAYKERNKECAKEHEAFKSIFAVKQREIEQLQKLVEENRFKMESATPNMAQITDEEAQVVHEYKSRQADQNARYSEAMQHLNRLESKLVTTSREIEFKEAQLSDMHVKLQDVRDEVNLVQGTAWTSTMTPRGDGFLVNMQNLDISGITNQNSRGDRRPSISMSVMDA